MRAILANTMAAAFILCAAVAQATEGTLTVSVADRPFQLRFATEPMSTPAGSPGANVTVDLSPIVRLVFAAPAFMLNCQS